MPDSSRLPTPNPAHPSTLPAPADYAPGPIREAHDAERHAVAQFTARHPEYSGLAPDVVAQAMNTYRTDGEHDERAKLADEGVPLGWHRDADDEHDDLTDALGRV